MHLQGGQPAGPASEVSARLSWHFCGPLTPRRLAPASARGPSSAQESGCAPAHTMTPSCINFKCCKTLGVLLHLLALSASCIALQYLPKDASCSTLGGLK